MGEFFHVLQTQSFLQHAVLTGVLASVACGIIGSYVVVKRISYIAGGISHTVLGGMGIAYFLGAYPLYGALAASLAAAIIIGAVSLKARQHEDTIIGALWAIGMAVGVIFITRTPGYNADLMSYLFGNILLVSRDGLYLIATLDLVIVATVLLLYKQFLAVCFDQEYASLRGVHVQFFYILLLCLTAVTVVILIQVVGLILVIALLTLPAAIASHHAGSLPRMMILATLLGLCFTQAGLYLSYQPDLPAGATIIVLSGTGYLLSLGSRPLLARVRRPARG